MRGLVLSSFFVGYLLLQIIGGKLADRFDGKIVLGFCVLLWSIFTILTPPAAAFGLAALITVRISMGMGEAVTFPAIFAPSVDGPPLARDKTELRIAGWCGHVSRLFMRLYLPLAMMPFARTGSRSVARTRIAWVVLGYPGPAVWAGCLHKLHLMAKRGQLSGHLRTSRRRSA